jgi:Fic family protein
MRILDKEFDMNSLFTEIDQLKNSLDKCRPLTEGEVARLRDEFLTEYTYNSNAIEGNTLTLRETALVLQGMTIDKKPLKDHLEAVGHRDAYNYIEMVATQKNPLDKRVIKEIHSLVLMDRPMDRGVFRKIPVQIMGAYVTPAEPWNIEPRLDDLLKKYTNEYALLHIVERIARFHMEFEGIHPFIDGNGRTGRLWQTALLGSWRNEFYGAPVENIVWAHQQEYYQAIRASTAAGECGPFIDFMLDKILRTLKAKGQTYEIATAETDKKTNKKTDQKIISIMKSMPDVTLAELANATGLSVAGVRWNIRKLKDANLIRRVGPDKGGHWEVV